MNTKGAVDVHCHMVFPCYMEAMRRAGVDPLREDGFPTPDWWDIEKHFAMMEALNIGRTILSLSSPHLHFGDDRAACELSRRINTESAELRVKYPDRIGFFACLPMPCVGESVEEAAYAFDVLGAAGVKVASNSRGVYLGDPAFDPLFAVLNRRGAVVVIHPTRPQAVPENCFTSGPIPLFEFIVDTTRAVINMIMHGTLERFPDIKVVVPHSGSFVPWLYSRLTSIQKVLSANGLLEPVDVERSSGKLYFDIAGPSVPVAIRSLLLITDTSHILYGSDYPYTPVEMIKTMQEQLLTVPEIRQAEAAVFRENALRILPD